MSDWTEQFDFAHHLADVADAISLKHFRNAQTKVKSKADGTPVTEADEAIERALRDEIGAAYPDHGIYGEEEGDTSGGASTRWILDPIDGTKNFSWGINIWGTLIALESDGEIALGIASAPGVGERYAAARGQGATRNGDAINVSEVADLAAARFGFTSAKWIHSLMPEVLVRFLEATHEDRGIGDFYGHMLVAAGALDLMIEPAFNPWDAAPLIVIVEEAGGRFTNLGGQRTIYGMGGVSTNGALHQGVLELIQAGLSA